MMDTLYCISCGTCNPEYRIIKGMKYCKICRDGAVLTVNEMIDVINDLQVQGLLPSNFLSDRVEQQFQRGEIDFDDDLLSVEQAIALEDAMRDMYDIDEER